MLTIFVDGDACPVKEEAIKVAIRHNLKIKFVANQWLRLQKVPNIEMILAPQGLDEADNLIAEQITAFDICISSDIPLASRCVEKNAFVLTPKGDVLDEDKIGLARATRDLMTHLRDTQQIEGQIHNSFDPKDRSRFLDQLDQLIRKIERLKA